MVTLDTFLVFQVRSRCTFFFFNDTATTEIYSLSLHDALPISSPTCGRRAPSTTCCSWPTRSSPARSEEHTSEIQSLTNLVCRLLLEKKKKTLHARNDTHGDEGAVEDWNQASSE